MKDSNKSNHVSDMIVTNKQKTEILIYFRLNYFSLSKKIGFTIHYADSDRSRHAAQFMKESWPFTNFKR